jgi:hypothetical protein
VGHLASQEVIVITPHLVSWQWQLYSEGHRARRNLVVHALTVPVFIGGTLLLVASPLLGLWWAAAGAAAVVVALGAQGRGHAIEETPPAPFRSPLDVVARLLVEQFFTFPRFVLSGGFSRAWRASQHT